MVVTQTDNVTVVTGRLVYQFVSEPIDAQTINGTMKFAIKAQVLNPTDGSMGSLFVIRVVSADGSTVTGTLLDQVTVLAPGSPFSRPTFGSITNVNAGAAALTEVVSNQGDRIVIEYGLYNGNVSTDDGKTQIGGDGATDYLWTNGQTTDLNPWVEFSNTITMAPASGAVGLMMAT